MAKALNLNKKIVLFTVTTVSIATAILLFYSYKKTTHSKISTQPQLGKVATLVGKVHVKHFGGDSFQEIKLGTTIKHLDRIRTEGDSKLEIEFSNGFKLFFTEFSDMAFQFWNSDKIDSPIYLDFAKGSFEILKSGRPSSMFALKGTELINLSKNKFVSPNETSESTANRLPSLPKDTTNIGSDYVEQDPVAIDNDSSLFKSLSNQQIKDYVRDNEHLLQRCQMNALRTEKELKGRIVVGFSILNKGDTEDVRILKTTLKNVEFESCVLSVFNRFVFPSYEGQKIYISYPISFL